LYSIETHQKTKTNEKNASFTVKVIAFEVRICSIIWSKA